MSEREKTSVEKTESAKKIASKGNSNQIYENIEENVLRFFRWLSGVTDKLFFSSRNTALFALLLACLAYFVATYDASSSSTLTSSKVLSNVSVNSRYNSESFELSGAPMACEIVLTGEATNVNNAAAKKGYCQIDLEGYTEGTHTVSMTAVGYGDNVKSVISPSEVTITLKKKTTAQFDLTYDFINKNAMESKYILSEPEFSQGTRINIRASQDTLNSIAMVKALIDVSNVTSDFEVDAPIVAYDKNGQSLNAEIVPSTISAKVKVSSPSNEVEIKLKPTGAAPSGLAIDTVLITDHQTTRIYGPQNIIDAIGEVYVNFDMSTITENGNLDMTLPIVLPTGVNASDVSTVNVKVTLSQVSTKEIENVVLNVTNNINNLGIADIDFKEVNVTVSGSENNIATVKADDIYVWFEMPSEVGTYDVPLYVKSESNPYCNFALSSGSVHISVVEAN